MTPDVAVFGPGWNTLGEAPGPQLWAHHGPGPADPAGLQAWLRRGCSGPAPVRQGFCAVLREPDGSVLAAVSSRLEACLLYALVDGRLLVAHHPRHLLAALDPLPDLDVQKLVDLTALYDDPRTTVYRGVHRLPIGHRLRWRPGMTVPAVTRWFDPTSLEPLRIKPDDAPGLMREVIRDAVAASLPAGGDVAATLSGGLDSSMIVATAASLLHPQGRVVHCATHRPLPGTPDPGRYWEADDGPYAEQMCREVPGLTWEGLMNEARTTPLDALQAGFPATWYPALNPANTVWIDQLIEWAAGSGSPVLLTGATGNGPFSRDRAGPARQLAVEHRYDLLLHQIWRRHRAGEPWRQAARRTAGEAAPPWVRRLRTNRATGPGFAEVMPIRHDALSPAARIRLRRLGSPGPCQRDWVDLVLRDASVSTVAQWRSDSVWWSDPLSDPEVETLALRLPHEAWLVDPGSRPLARRAMRGLVPDLVRLRTTRGAQAADEGTVLAGTARGEVLRPMLARFGASPVCREVLDLDRLTELGRDIDALDADIWRDAVGRALGFGSFVLWYETIRKGDPGTPRPCHSG